MSKIVFFCIPAHGHTNPTLGVVRELVERGHQVYYYSYNSFREKIEAVGATFVSCDDYDIEQNLRQIRSCKCVDIRDYSVFSLLRGSYKSNSLNVINPFL